MNQVNMHERRPSSADSNPYVMMPPERERETRSLISAPETAVPHTHLFPTQLSVGLWLGVIAGAIAGLIFGRLLFTGFITLRGWEIIFSLTPFLFHFFWTLFGVVLGLLIAGVAAIRSTPTPQEA